MSLLIQKNVALAPLTTLKVGGAARFFVEARTEEEISQALAYAKQNNLPLFALGSGSNVLISDDGFNGLVLKISLCGISSFQDKTNVIVTAQAGEDWDEFVKFCVENDLQGVECLSGIPGTVGATPVQNVGAYGQEVSETIVSIRVLELKTGKIFEMNNAQCGFVYRTSIFNTTHRNEFIVLAVTFCLKPQGAPKIVYKDLQQFFGEKPPSLIETRQAVLQIRAAKSMVIDERDPNSRSAGSFFKNPVVPREKFTEIEQMARPRGIESVPNFVVDEENVKIPAAWLIENSGFHKGYRLRNAGLSTKHTLAIVNLGNATARDILALKNEIQAKVFENFDILLKPEPVFIGFEETSRA
jgi:UDP-N-acetylmuramate dehydrogenase